MPRLTLSALALVAALAAPPVAHAQSGAGSDAPAQPLPMTGAEIQALITECQAEKPETLQAYRACYGYQTGILLGTLFYAEVSGEPLPFCLTQDVKDTEINTAISEFVASHDEVADLSLPATVVGAMVKAFPCKPEESE